jgi:hypothetical protein
MQDAQKVSLIRVCLWAGIIVDAVAAVQLLLPDLWAGSYGIQAHVPGDELNVALWGAAALMAGWTVLLFWADRKPAERKEIMLITLFPVLAGLTLNNVYGVYSGLMDVWPTAAIIAMQVAIGSLWVIVYYLTRGLKADPYVKPVNSVA